MKLRQLSIAIFFAIFSMSISVHAKIDKSEYRLVYSSESDSAALRALPHLTQQELDSCHGSFMNRENLEQYWHYSPRQTSTWNKRMAETDEEKAMVVEPDSGTLRLFAKTFKRYTSRTETVTGGVETNFYFQYGIIEVKALNNPHASNFPAIWMMPNDQSTVAWPQCGEIDIMEQIGSSRVAYGTVHNGYRYNGGTGPFSNSMETTEGYHVYTLEWNDSSLTWYIDGTQLFQYKKDYTQEAAQQFPYNKPYRIILNQSVGMNSSWGTQAPDKTYTYEQDIAYVRIYQQMQEPTCVENISKQKPTITSRKGLLKVQTETPTQIHVADILGHIIYNGTITRCELSVPSGIYIVNGTKALVK